MPLFSGKFNPRTSKPRKSSSLSSVASSRPFDPDHPEGDVLKEFKCLDFNLGDDLNFHFDDTKGEWISQGDGQRRHKSEKKESSSSSIKSELTKLRKTNESLQEENRLLKLKVELLVDLVIEKGENFV